MGPGEAPLFNLGAVLKETGLHADTLRAWERRYGVPRPQRSPGGHRLYSERDIHLVRWLRARQGEGMTISRAVTLWRSLLEAGTDPLSEMPAAHAAPQVTLDGNLHILRDEWLSAVKGYDAASAGQTLRKAFSLYLEETVLLDLLLPALNEIGEQWQLGTLAVQQEHFASGLISRKIGELIDAAPAPHREGTFVLACPASEQHALPLQFLAFLLRRQGRKVVYLNADVPLRQLEDTVRAIKPMIVVLAAQRLTSAARLREAAGKLGHKNYLVGFGGRVFNRLPALRSDVAGDFLGESLAEAVTGLEDMIRKPASSADRRGRTRHRRGRTFYDARIQIEGSVQKRFSKSALPSRHLSNASAVLGEAVGAALEFGNIKYLDLEMEWIPTHLQREGMPAERVTEYMVEYAHAVRRILGHDHAGTAEWLEQYASRGLNDAR